MAHSHEQDETSYDRASNSKMERKPQALNFSIGASFRRPRARTLYPASPYPRACSLGTIEGMNFQPRYNQPQFSVVQEACTFYYQTESAETSIVEEAPEDTAEWSDEIESIESEDEAGTSDDDDTDHSKSAIGAGESSNWLLLSPVSQKTEQDR